MSNKVEELEREIAAAKPDAHDVEKMVAAAWETSPEMREEFESEETAQYYYGAVSRGLIKILKQGG